MLLFARMAVVILIALLTMAVVLPSVVGVGAKAAYALVSTLPAVAVVLGISSRRPSIEGGGWLLISIEVGFMFFAYF